MSLSILIDKVQFDDLISARNAFFVLSELIPQITLYKLLEERGTSYTRMLELGIIKASHER